MLQVILPPGYSPDAKEGEEGGDPIRVIDGMHRRSAVLELIAEGEQEVLIKEQQEKERLAKEKFEEEQKERAEKGLPPLKLDTEEDSKSDGGSKEKKKAGADSIIGKEAEKKMVEVTEKFSENMEMLSRCKKLLEDGSQRIKQLE